MKGNKNQIIIDGKLVEVSNDVYRIYQKGENRIKYFQYNLKNNKHIYDKNGTYIYSKLCKEESLERMIERKQIQLYDNKQDVEDIVEHRLKVEKLHKAITKLIEEEQKLIQALFFEDKTEREYAKEIKISQPAVHKQKIKILNKIKILLKN